jgi:hypothetical protein
MAEYNVQTPDGSTYNIKADTDEQAQSAINDLLGSVPQMGKAESFGRAAANNFPLAPQAIAGLSSGDYSKNMADWNQKAKEAKSTNPITYGAGAVTGAMAPLAIPGVGEAMAANPIAANAALGAASAMSNTDVLQHPEEAAKDVVKGGLIGGATAGVLGKILPGSEALTNRAEKNAVQSLGLSPKSMIDSGKAGSMGKFANENQGLIQGSLSDRYAVAEGLKSKFGADVGAAKEGAGSFANAADTAQFTDPLMQKASENAGRMDPFFKSQGNVYAHGAQDIQQNGTTIEGLQALKDAYGSRAFNNATGEVKDEAAKDVWVQVTRAMDHLVGKSAPEYQAAKTGYGQAMQASEGIGKQLGVERTEGGSAGVGGHGLHSLIKQIPGISSPETGIPMGAGMAAIGHPVLGAVVGLHSLTSNPQVRNKAFNAAAGAVDSAGNVLKLGGTDALVSHFINNSQAYGKYAAPLHQAMQTGGKQGFAATSFVMRQQHPELNDIMLNAGGQDEPNR